MTFPAMFDLVTPMLRLLPPEAAHESVLTALELGLFPRDPPLNQKELAVSAAGLSFPNPISIAAGFDKNARVPHALLALGCGFAEIGTVTPRAQAGNPQPRVFRLTSDHAIINRLGFNNAGHEAALERLERRRPSGIVGVNIGANKDASDRVADYVAGIEAFNSVASYFTINISSPNTPGLRDLQAPEALDQLLGRVMSVRNSMAAAGTPRRPVFVKLSPDIAEADLEAIVARIEAHHADGIAVSNTTLSRTGIASNASRQAGGLSGRPLFYPSTVMLARVFELTKGRLPLIGIGGIECGETALAKIEAGASLIQLYTGLVYRGPGIVRRIKSHLASAVRASGCASIGELTGRRAAEWAVKAL